MYTFYRKSDNRERKVFLSMCFNVSFYRNFTIDYIQTTTKRTLMDNEELRNRLSQRSILKRLNHKVPSLLGLFSLFFFLQKESKTQNFRSRRSTILPFVVTRSLDYDLFQRVSSSLPLSVSPV